MSDEVSPLDRAGLCLLSLDGGGVRGLSTLLILKALMAQVNDARSALKQPSLKPCELFDMIGGTSTGGIIAIMLGRLEMDVDECIEAYTSMFERIFGKKKKKSPITFFGKIQGRFDSKLLEACVKEILEKRKLPELEPFNDGKERFCKVVVCAKAVEITSTVLLRSYNSPNSLNNIPATICESVRATSAATSFFDATTIGPRNRKFVDAGLGANNPVDLIWNEAQAIWCKGDQELPQMLKCIVSIGTGNPGTKPISEGAFKFFSKTLVSIATQTEETAKIFITRHRHLYEQNRYFRFNVQQGLQGVGLEEYKKAALIDTATTAYMDSQETTTTLRSCISNLKQKDLRTPITFVPFARNEDFVPRLDIHKQLDALLQQSKNRTIAITGLGGCGKTQVALEYAYEYQEKTQSSIFWIQADSEANFIKTYSDIARLAQLSSDLKGADLLRAVKTWIESQTRWLVVLDNADDIQIFEKKSVNLQHLERETTDLDLLEFLPKGVSGTTIITSRDNSTVGILTSLYSGIEIGGMTFKESLKLLRILTRQSITDDASEYEQSLLSLLENLPLGISQASAYIRTTRTSIQQYLTALTESEERQVQLLGQEWKDRFRSGVPNSVMHTWLISMKRVAEENECCKKILNTIAFLDNHNITFELLSDAAGSSYTEDSVLLAAGRLMDFSFIRAQKSVNDTQLHYEQHPLVQLAAREAMSANDSKLYSGKALSIVTEIFPTGNYGTWDTCEEYLAHSLKVIRWQQAEDHYDLVPMILTRIARYYWEQGRSDEAEKLEVEVLELRKSVLGERHPETIRAIANLASTWSQQGRSNEAEKLDIEVLELRKSVLGERHPDTISAMAILAMTWWDQGRYDEAEKLQVEVIELRKSVLGERHPETIRAIANLASTWSQQGRSDEAEKLQVEVLELQKSVLGERHPDIIRAMANLAVTWSQQGRSSKAEKLETEVLELWKSVLGERHPDTISAMANLAMTWWDQGRYDEAEKLQVVVVDLRKAVLGKRHPDTVNSVHFLQTIRDEANSSDS